MRSGSPRRIQIDTTSPSSKKDVSSTYHIQTYSPHRQSPVVRSSSSDRISASNRSSQISQEIPLVRTRTEELLFEDTFRNTLSSLKRMILEYNSHQEFISSPNLRKEERSQELISEEIRRTIMKMQNLQQNNYSESYKIAAYSLIAAQLLDEIEHALTQQNAVSALDKLRDEHDVLIQQYKSLQNHSSYDKAILEQKVALLDEENKSLKEQLSTLTRKRGTLVFELETRERMEDDAHAKYVQLHIQIVNYHTKIQHMMNSLESGVRTRIGFIPRDILSQINKVRNTPIPGADILYTRKIAKKSTDRSPLVRSRSLDSTPSPSHINPTSTQSPTADKTTTSPAATSNPVPGGGENHATPSIERMTQREFYKQLSTPQNLTMSPIESYQENSSSYYGAHSNTAILPDRSSTDSPYSLEAHSDQDFFHERGENSSSSSTEIRNGKDKYERYIEMKKNLYLLQSLQLKERGGGQREIDPEELSNELEEKLAGRSVDQRKKSSPVIMRSASYPSPADSSERYSSSPSSRHATPSPYSSK